MNTREIAVEFRLAHWAQIMQERVASGMSIKAYCKTNGIGANTYFYWQKKLRAAAAQQLAAAAQPERQALVPSGWTAVTEDIATPEQESSLTLRVGGVEVQVRQGFDEALLASVCRALSQC